MAKTCFNRDFQLNVGHPRCLDSLDQGPAFWLRIWTKHNLQSFWSLPIIATNQTTFLHELTDSRTNEHSDSTHHFPRGGGIWLQRVLTVASTDSLSSATSHLMLKKKISFKNIWEKGWAVLFNRHFSYDLLTTSLFFFTMPCVLYANIFNNIITLCCRQISVSCFQGTLAQ